jgi:hypothetical protein
MLEYASIRLTLRCNQRHHVAQGHGRDREHDDDLIHSERAGKKLTQNSRRKAANEAAFTAPAMKPVTGDGAPWYTSGTHMWNGTAES